MAAFRRQRLIQAIAELSRERGYRGTTVADLATRTRMGRGTIYGLFSSREAIFLAAIDHAAERLSLDIGEASAGAGAYPQRVRRGLGAALSWVAEEPEFAHALLVESQSATEAAFARYREELDRLASMLRTCTPRGARRPPGVDQLLVGGIAAVIGREVQRGRAEQAPELLAELATFVLGSQGFA
jgi:AcrR family transcriptional regulator